MNSKAIALALALVIIGAAFAYYFLQPETGLSSTSTSSLSSATSAQSTVNGTAWTTYHRDNSRSGFDPSVAPTSIALSWKSAHLDGAVYAEPLVFGGSVFVATENNSVYALRASTGSILWRVNLGAPVPRSALPCGDIDPTGITGTPVIDPTSRLIYVVAFLNPVHHVLFAISVDDGSIIFQQSADPNGSNPTVQQQRAALTLANGFVYVPYGGLDGDCGDYHGWLVGIRADGPGSTISYQVPTSREGGIWATSGAVVSSSGDLYVATGNGESRTSFDHGDSVIELSPNLQETAYFAPSNWAALNSADLDLGSAGPIPIGNGMLFQIGKSGVGYLLNASSLGGIGGQVFSASVCDGAYGGLAYAPPYLFIPCTDGLRAVKIGSNTFQVMWQGPDFTAGPPIVTGDDVWTIDTGSGTVHVFNVQDGSQVFSASVGAVVHFVTPSSGDGSVFVAAASYLYAFSLQ